MMGEQWDPHQRSTWPWRVGRLKKDIVLRIWQGHSRKADVIEFAERELPAGSLVKIVMVSRFGDVGITDDLAAETGYRARIKLDDMEPVS